MSRNREYKYVITAEQRSQLEAEISQHMVVDESFGANGEFPIVTQYYDSPDRDCYWEKVRRLKSRRKIRVRIIGSGASGGTPTAFIEVKHKQKGGGGERQLPVSVETASRFVSGDHEILRGMLEGANRGERMVINEIFDLIDRRGHEPVMQVSYQRRAYTSAEGNFRMTFDTDLACRSGKHPLRPDDPGITDGFLDPAFVVAEVKSVGQVPYWFRHYIARADFSRQGFSKYCTALKEHDAVLREQLDESA